MKTPETQKDKGDKKDVTGSVNNSTSVTWPVVRGMIQSLRQGEEAGARKKQAANTRLQPEGVRPHS